jgi:hypothetical protein
MTLTVLDPCTGKRVAVEVPVKRQPHRARRWLLCELDRIARQVPQVMKS